MVRQKICKRLVGVLTVALACFVGTQLYFGVEFGVGIPKRKLQSDDSGSAHDNANLQTGKVMDGLDMADKSRHASAEVRHIGFLKVHKAASSTMQNMFFRFGLKRNLTFVFTTHPNYFSRGTGGHLPLVKPKLRTGGYDVLCNHGTFDYDVYSGLLPKDSVYLGIVRDPLEVFISGVNYYSQPSQLLSYLSKIPGNKLQNLIQNSQKYDKDVFSYTRNVMARDFGFQPTLNGTEINKRVTELDRIFKLVLLVEYFDESLVLMKRYLHWKVQDILYISNNVYTKRGVSVSDIGPSDVKKFRTRNKLDYIVYDFFYDRFWKQFRTEPENIHQEVLNFKEMLKELFTFCKGTLVPGLRSDTLFINQTQWNEPFSVSKADCDYMTKGEQDFITLLRRLQGSELGQRKVLKRDINRLRMMRRH